MSDLFIFLVYLSGFLWLLLGCYGVAWLVARLPGIDHPD